MPSFGNATIGEVDDGFLGEPAQPPIGFSADSHPVPHRPSFLNAHIGAAPDQVAPNATTPSIIAAQDTPAMDQTGDVLLWDIVTGTWSDPTPPPPTEGTSDSITGPLANRVQLVLQPIEFANTIVTGSVLLITDVTGTPEAVTALEGLQGAVLAPHLPGGPAQLALVGAGAIDWTGATATVTKVS